MDLARALRALASTLGVQRIAAALPDSIRQTIKRWETKGIRPDQRYCLLLAHLYAVRDDRSDLGPGSDFDRLFVAFELMGVPQKDCDDLRRLVARINTGGSRSFLSFLSGELQQRIMHALADPDRVDLVTMQQLQAAVTTIRRRGSGGMPMVRMLLAVAPFVEVLKRLLDGSQADPIRQALCVCSVQAFTCAGSLSFDLRDSDSMQAFYDDADLAARELRDGWLGGFSLSSRSMILLHGFAAKRDALALAQQACKRADAGSSLLTRARTRAILAEMEAAQGPGHERRSQHELTLAKFHVDGDCIDDPASDFYAETRHGGVEGMRAHVNAFDGVCLMHLGRWDDAERVLAQAVAGLPRNDADKQKSIILSDQALVAVKLGNPEQSASLLGQAIAIAARLGGSVPTLRIREVRRELGYRWPGDGRLREIDDRLQAARLLT